MSVHKPQAVPRRCSAGFTLIEILVVLLVIGIGVSFVSLSMNLNDPEQQVEQEVDELLETLRFAADTAVFSGEALGLYITPPATNGVWRYGWMRYRDNEWEPLESDVLQEHELPDWLGLVATVEDQPVDLYKVAAKTGDSKPLIAIYSSGELTPFILEFEPLDTDSDEALRRWVTLDEDSQLVVYDQDDPKLDDIL